MTGIVIASFPIIALIVAGIVGVPLWNTFRHPHTQPDYAEAKAHFRAKAAAQPYTSDFVPATKVPALHGLTVARQHLAPRSTVPGRRHARPAGRAHTAGTHTAGSPARPGAGTTATR